MITDGQVNTKYTLHTGGTWDLCQSPVQYFDYQIIVMTGPTLKTEIHSDKNWTTAMNNRARPRSRVKSLKQGEFRKT